MSSDKNFKEGVTSFNGWLSGGGDLVEKIVSLIVLVIEIALLFLHNVDENVSFYLFTGLNLSFSLFIWYSFVRKRNNLIYTFDSEFGLLKNKDVFPHNNNDGYHEKLTKYNDEGKKDEKLKKELKEKYSNSFTKTDAENGNRLIKQFSTIRYAWLFTGLLYIVIILNHWLFNEGSNSKSLDYLKPILNCAIIIINLTSTYFYLVAYYVMYYLPINKPKNDFTTKSVDDIPQNIYIKKTVWWFGLVFLIFILYIFCYNYFDIENNKHSYSLICENKTNKIDTLRITGENIDLLGNTKSKVYLSESDERQTIVIGSLYEKENKNHEIYIEIDKLHKKRITIIDTIHKSYILSAYNNIPIDGNIEIIAQKKDAKINFKSDSKINNIEFHVRSKFENSNAIDFVFQIITGILCALIMCFFVGRFESLTFQTPSWVLIVLYFYAVIQGFLVILNVDFLKENELLLSAHDTISKFVYFIALLGKVVLYVYIIGLFSTKRLFYYFVVTHKERNDMKNNWKNYWKRITIRKN